MEPNVLQLTRRREAIKCNRKAHTRTLKADGRLARVPFVWPLEGQCGGVGQQLPPHPPPHRRTAGPCPNASCLDFQEGNTGTVLSAPSEAGGPGMCCLHLLGAAAAQPVPGLTHRELGMVPEHRPAGRDGSGSTFTSLQSQREWERKNTEPKSSDLSERFGFLLPPAAPSQI